MATNISIQTAGPDMETISQTPTRTTRRTRDEIQQWLTDYLAFLLDEKPEAVNIRLSFDSHGVDSAAAVSLVADLEEWMGLELDPTIVYDHPTVPELTNYLARQQDNGAT